MISTICTCIVCWFIVPIFLYNWFDECHCRSLFVMRWGPKVLLHRCWALFIMLFRPCPRSSGRSNLVVLLHLITQQLRNKEGPANLPTDQRNRKIMALPPFNLVSIYRGFNPLNDRGKQLYVGGWYQLVPRGLQPMLDIPNDIDEDDDADAELEELFSQPTFTSLVCWVRLYSCYKNQIWWYGYCFEQDHNPWHDSTISWLLFFDVQEDRRIYM